MDLRDRALALYGRFSPGARDRFQQTIISAGGAVTRDLTRASVSLVVGARAISLIDSGALPARLRLARARGLPIRGERGFTAELADEPAEAKATLALPTALSGTGLTPDDADLLAAFDLAHLDGDYCRFRDVSAFRTAGELLFDGSSLGEVVTILIRARDQSPRGRHKIVVTRSGDPALRWEDGLTTLEGQGFLPLEEDHATVDDLFEAASIAEANGELDEAARLYDQCARADKRDAIAPYNYANIRMAQGEPADAAMAYQRALSRDPRLIEARYNLSEALEAGGKVEGAASELDRVLAADPGYADAVFNLARLRMKLGAMAEAKALYERYLTLGPPDDWAATARKAISYCSAQLSAQAGA
jgi:tetratricopeptide (TPR) repeat protein